MDIIKHMSNKAFIKSVESISLRTVQGKAAEFDEIFDSDTDQMLYRCMKGKGETALKDYRQRRTTTNSLSILYTKETGEVLTESQYCVICANANRLESFGSGRATGFQGIKPAVSFGSSVDILDAEGYRLRGQARMFWHR